MGLMLGASALFVSCLNNGDDILDGTTVNNTITRTIALADTRSAVDADGKIHFTSTEYFTPFVWSDVNVTSNLATAVKLLRGEGGVVKVVHGEDAEATSYKYGFVSPAANKASFDGEKYTVTLPQTQQPAADGSTFDAKADVLVSELLDIDVANTEDAATKFKRMFTFVKVTLPKDATNGDLDVAYSSERLKAFEIKALDGTPLSGVATVPATNVADDCVPTFVAGNASVMATFDEEIDFKAERTVWLVVNPATFTGLEMTLYTQSGKYTRTFETFVCEFKANTINKLTFKHDGTGREGVNSTIVDGVRYSQTSSANVNADASSNYGLGTLVSAAELNVVFLNDKNATYDFHLSNQGLTKDFVLVGNNNVVNPDEKVCVKITGRNSLRNPDGLAAFKNVKIDATEMTQETAFRLENKNENVGGINTLIFEDCDIVFSRYNFISAYNSPAGMGIERIVLRNCRIIYTATESELANKTPQFFAFNNSKITIEEAAAGALKYKEFIVENCVFHWTNAQKATNSNGVAGVVPFTIFNHNTSGVAFKNLDVTFNNNTLIDVFGNSSNAVLMFGGIAGEKSLNSLEVKKNLVYTTYKTTYPTMVALRYAAVNDWANFEIPANDNIAWLEGDLTKTGMKTYYVKDGWASDPNNNTAFKEEATATNLLPNIIYTDGISSGSYEVGASYAGYGSTLK